MIKIVIDVGLPPAWIPVLAAQGWEAVHWSTEMVRPAVAPDSRSASLPARWDGTYR